MERIGFGQEQMVGSVGIHMPAGRAPGPQARLLMQAIRDEVVEIGLV